MSFTNRIGRRSAILKFSEHIRIYNYVVAVSTDSSPEGVARTDILQVQTVYSKNTDELANNITDILQVQTVYSKNTDTRANDISVSDIITITQV